MWEEGAGEETREEEEEGKRRKLLGLHSLFGVLW